MAIALSLLVAGAVGGVLGVTIQLVSSESRLRAETELEGARTAFYSLLDSRAKSAAALARLVTELPIFRAHMMDTRLSDDRATIAQMTDTYRLQLGAAFAVVTDNGGRWLASPGWPSVGVPPQSLLDSIASAGRGQAGRAIIDWAGELFLVVTLPARFAEEVLGTLAVGFNLDDGLAQELARVAQCEVMLVSRGRVAATSLRARAHSDTGALAAEASTADTGLLPDLRRVGQYQYVGGAFPLWPDSPALDVG
ncbi:MAG: hypothetical protein OEW19_14790, partial [Acidobacteriota bacterium]|nr:hypothetical protein [Acidobacteriota bacterium]